LLTKFSSVGVVTRSVRLENSLTVSEWFEEPFDEGVEVGWDGLSDTAANGDELGAVSTGGRR